MGNEFGMFRHILLCVPLLVVVLLLWLSCSPFFLTVRICGKVGNESDIIPTIDLKMYVCTCRATEERLFGYLCYFKSVFF